MHFYVYKFKICVHLLNRREFMFIVDSSLFKYFSILG